MVASYNLMAQSYNNTSIFYVLQSLVGTIMTFQATFANFNTLEPDETLRWELDPDNTECAKEVHGVRLAMNPNHPGTIKVRHPRKREIDVILNAYDHNQMIKQLQEYTALDNNDFAELQDAIAQIRESFQRHTTFTAIELEPPKLTSTHRYTINLYPAAGSHFSADDLRQHLILVGDYELHEANGRITLLANDAEVVNRIAEILNNDFDFSDPAVATYSARFAYINCLRRYLRNLDVLSWRTPAPLSDRWFYRRLMQLSPEDLGHYINELEANKHMRVLQPPTDFFNDNHPAYQRDDVNFMETRNQLLAYLNERCRHNQLVAIADNPRKHFFDENVEIFVEIAAFTLATLTVLICLPILTLKLIGKLLSLGPLGGLSYHSPILPALGIRVFNGRWPNANDLGFSIGPLGAVFDIASVICTHVVALALTPVLVATALVATAGLLIKTYLIDNLNPLKHYRIKRDVRESEHRLQNHGVFRFLDRFITIKSVSKGFRQLVNHRLGGKAPAGLILDAEDLTINAELEAAQEQPIIELKKIPSEFRFFTKLPRDLQSKIVNHAVDAEVCEDIAPLPEDEFLATNQGLNA